MTREEVVKWLESLKREIGKTENRTLWHYAESIDMAIEALADRPTGWIPVSERLPEKSKQVMCCDKQGRVFTSAMTYINSNGEPSFGKHYGVIAWMPLPQPMTIGDD